MKNIYKHVISVAVFISLTVYLFNPVFFENKGIKQHDIDQWKYSANETIEFRKKIMRKHYGLIQCFQVCLLT